MRLPSRGSEVPCGPDGHSRRSAFYPWLRRGRPHTSLGIGASAVYLAVVEPPLEEVQAFWATGRTATVEQQGLAARVTGVLPSEFEGADGLEVYVSAHGAWTRALIPLTVFSMSIPAN